MLDRSDFLPFINVHHTKRVHFWLSLDDPYDGKIGEKIIRTKRISISLAFLAYWWFSDWMLTAWYSEQNVFWNKDYIDVSLLAIKFRLIFRAECRQ